MTVETLQPAATAACVSAALGAAGSGLASLARAIDQHRRLGLAVFLEAVRNRMLAIARSAPPAGVALSRPVRRELPTSARLAVEGPRAVPAPSSIAPSAGLSAAAAFPAARITLTRRSGSAGRGWEIVVGPVWREAPARAAS